METRLQIQKEVKRAILLIGGKEIATILDMMETHSDEEVLSDLKKWNEAKSAELKSLVLAN